MSPALPVLRPRTSNVHLPALAVPWAGQQLARRLGRFPVEQRVRATLALCWADPSRVADERLEEAMVEAERRAHLEHDGDAMIRSLRSLMAAYLRPDRWPLWRLAARVQVPTLLVYGLRDRLVDPRTALARGPDVPGQPPRRAAGQRARVADGAPRGGRSGGTPAARRGVGQPCDPAILTIQSMPNLSRHMPNSSPHICFSSGTATVPPSESFCQ